MSSSRGNRQSKNTSHTLAFLLSGLGSVLAYFALQVVAVFVAFFLYGSGQTFSAKQGTVSALVVLLQLAAAIGLFYRNVWLKSPAALLVAVLTPLVLFLWLEMLP